MGAEESDHCASVRANEKDRRERIEEGDSAERERQQGRDGSRLEAEYDRYEEVNHRSDERD